MVTDTRNYTYLNSAECKDYFYFLKKDLEDIYYSSYFAEVAEYFTMEGPVSYTHLDVYKRQLYSLFHAGRCDNCNS